MIIAIKILVDLICGALFLWGGYSFIEARRFIMPSLLACASCLIIHSFWPMTMLAVMGTLCLGYFSGDNWGRALWVFLQAVVIGLGCALSGHLSWFLYVPYVLLAGVLGGLYKNWKQIYGDFIVGCYIGSIIFLVH